MMNIPKNHLILLFILCSYLASSQCYLDRHNTSLDAGWLSCSASENPNPNRPSGYWILYDLEERQAVNSIKLWNVNHPDHLDSGVKTVEIDFLNGDGYWQTYSVHNLERAEASGFYEGEELDLPGEFVTNKILINFIENYGGPCSGIAEARIGLINKTTSTEDISADHFKIVISPNPFSDVATVTIDELYEKEIQYQVLNNIGQIIANDIASTKNGTVSFDIYRNGLPSGNYFLKISDGIRVSSRKLSITNSK